jgi:hypothetical protein
MTGMVETSEWKTFIYVLSLSFSFVFLSNKFNNFAPYFILIELRTYTYLNVQGRIFYKNLGEIPD